MSHKLRGHAPLPPSGANRWMNCPGSYFMEKDKPDLPRSKYADEGTYAHEKWEELMILDEKGLKEDFDDLFLEIFEEDEELALGLKEFIHWLNTLEDAFMHLCDEPKKVKRYIEKQFKFTDHIWGTIDRGLVGKRNGLLESIVVDLKWGEGKVVSARENPQAILYGIMQCPDADRIRIYIYQPRTPGDPVSRFTLEKPEIEEWKQKLFKAEADALSINSYLDMGVVPENYESILNPGEHCRWCKAQAVCPAVHNNFETSLVNIMSEKGLAAVPLPSLINVFKKREELRALIKSVEVYLTTQAQLGADYGEYGLKLVESKGKRSWIYKGKELKDKLIECGLSEEDIYTKKIKGITDLKKLLSKEELDKLVSTPPIRKQLVSSDDVRVEVESLNLIEKLEG